MVLLLVAELSVDLVRQDENVLLLHDLRDFPKVLLLHDGTGGVVGEGQHQKLRPVGELLQQLLRGQPEFVLLLQLDDDRHTARHPGTGHIGHIARLRNQHLITRIQHDPHGHVNGLGAADGHHGFLHGIIVHAVLPLHIGGNLLPQLPETRIGGIEGASLLQGMNALLPDMPGSIKVRLAHAQRDGILHFRHNIEELPDAAGLYIYNGIVQGISHGDTFILSSFRGCSITVPWSL